MSIDRIWRKQRIQSVSAIFEIRLYSEELVPSYVFITLSFRLMHLHSCVFQARKDSIASSLDAACQRKQILHRQATLRHVLVSLPLPYCLTQTLESRRRQQFY